MLVCALFAAIGFAPHAPTTSTARQAPASRASPIRAALDLDAARSELMAAIKDDAPVTEADRELVAMYSELIAPFEDAVYAPALEKDERADRIVSLSKNLDVVEGAVRGPMHSSNGCADTLGAALLRPGYDDWLASGVHA